MAVPDWPNTFGYNMFLFPMSRWVGGIFYEHTHRLIASGIGLMTVILCVFLWLVEPRRWVRWFGVALVGLVSFQGLLGGLRVVLTRDEIGIFHALLAQGFFVAISVMAVVTSRRFPEKRWAHYEPDPWLRWGTLSATGLIFLQLGLGAGMRHEHIGLSIPDFPLAYGKWLPDTSPAAVQKINDLRLERGEMPASASQIWLQMAHRGMALLIFVVVLTAAFRSWRAPSAVKYGAGIWLCLIITQVCLGAWTIWSRKAADVATAHMAVGALSLLVGSLLALRLFAGSRPRDFILPGAPNQRLMEHLA